MCIRITDPINGTILNSSHGKPVKNGIEIVVEGTCPKGARVTVNGKPAETSKDRFSCKVLLEDRETTIQALAKTASSESSDSARVFWVKGSDKMYRFSVDDNIFFLKDLSENAPRYSSLFDNGYMAFWRKIYEDYDAKIHLNIYYQTEEFSLSKGFEEFYNLTNDPQEKDNVIQQATILMPDFVREWRRKLNEFLLRVEISRAEPGFTQEDRELVRSRLRALGYIE